MGLVHIDLFATLDLVGQAPGGPDEDPGGFPFGGWQAPLFDPTVGEHVTAGLRDADALLLGRRTYDIFAAYWPAHENGVDGGIATLFNSIPKYVASRGAPSAGSERRDASLGSTGDDPSLGWAGSTRVGPDLVGAVGELRAKHEHVHVIGSLNLVQTLLRERLFDRLDLWIFPIVLGMGKKVFDGGAVPANLSLLEPPVTSPKGAVLLRYGVGPGEPGAGDMRREDRGVPGESAAAARRCCASANPSALSR